MTMDNDTYDLEERAFLEARDQVSDTTLIAQMDGAPDMGGATLVELSSFVSRRVSSEAAVPALASPSECIRRAANAALSVSDGWSVR
jgi:hypothetical protein